MVAFAQMRYTLLGNADHWFPGNTAATIDDSTMIAALKDSPFAERIPSILRKAHTLLFTKPAKRLSES